MYEAEPLGPPDPLGTGVVSTTRPQESYSTVSNWLLSNVTVVVFPAGEKTVPDDWL